MGLSGNGLPNIQATSTFLPRAYKLTLSRKAQNPVPSKKTALPPTPPKPQTQQPQPQTHPFRAAPNKSKTPSTVPKNRPGKPTIPAPQTTSTPTATSPAVPPPSNNNPPPPSFPRAGNPPSLHREKSTTTANQTTKLNGR